MSYKKRGPQQNAAAIIFRRIMFDLFHEQESASAHTEQFILADLLTLGIIDGQGNN